MGSSSKKYKEKEKSDRKRRHRSRSFSDDDSPKDTRRHKHSRRHHHKEKERRRDQRKHEYESNDSDVVEISDRDTSPTPQHSTQHRELSPEANAHQHQQSLSIDETNKLRAKLGMKPLQIESSKKDDGKKKDDWGEFYHKPASNIAAKNESEKLRNKLVDHKEKRKIDAKLARVKLLGESDSDDDALAWVDRSRSKEDAKKIAQQRAKALEEMDEQFGDVIESESRTKRQQKYTEKNLSGLQVEHDVNAFKEGKTVILTLKDVGVLEEHNDVLVNVNMIDDERYRKNVVNKSKKVLYNPYDVEQVDEFGNVQPKNLLHQYDEEIEGEKKDSFHIGSRETTGEHKLNVMQDIKAKLANKRVEFLSQSIGTSCQVASDYYNEEELEMFKKPKKKVRKIRQKAKFNADELEKITSGANNQNPTTSELKQEVDVIKSEVIEEKDDALERALRKARRVKQRDISLIDRIQQLAVNLKPELKDEQTDTGNIILNTTAEFCRTLGDIPTYGKSGNREEEIQEVDYDKDLVKDDSEDDCQIIEEASTSRSSKDHASSQAEPILDEEPDVGTGVGAALKLAMSKGYLDKEETNRPSNTRLAYLQAKHYSIEDKNYGDDNERGNRRERYSGPVQDFKERDGFKPNVKLEYIDDEGHVLNSKEAFRYLSHKFHGKGPGKNKIEKRLKKSQQEGLMKKMNSTDTPLGTLHMLQAKQKEMQSPYIVLSGGKTHSTSISKARR